MDHIPNSHIFTSIICRRKHLLALLWQIQRFQRLTTILDYDGNGLYLRRDNQW